MSISDSNLPEEKNPWKRMIVNSTQDNPYLETEQPTLETMLVKQADFDLGLVGTSFVNWKQMFNDPQTNKDGWHMMNGSSFADWITLCAAKAELPETYKVALAKINSGVPLLLDTCVNYDRQKGQYAVDQHDWEENKAKTFTKLSMPMSFTLSDLYCSPRYTDYFWAIFDRVDTFNLRVNLKKIFCVHAEHVEIKLSENPAGCLAISKDSVSGHKIIENVNNLHVGFALGVRYE